MFKVLVSDPIDLNAATSRGIIVAMHPTAIRSRCASMPLR